MEARNRYRPRFEELEQRAVPAVLKPHLDGRNLLNTTVSGQLYPSGTVQFGVAGGLLKGSAMFMSGLISQTGSLCGYSNAILLITTNHGTATTVNTGTADMSAGTFFESGTIIGGTGAFHGMSGSFTINGTFTWPNMITGTLTGAIAGPGMHHGHHHHK